MKRNLLLNLLQLYEPKASEEILFKEEILNFVHNNVDCFERSLEIGHITASCWLLNKAGTHALLMHHTKLDAWFQLGGHCDGDHDVAGIALKEAQEESGIDSIVLVDSSIFDIDVHCIPANQREKTHNHYDIRFLLQVMSDAEIIKNGESKDLQWITKDPAALPTDNLSVVRMFNKWVQRSR